jgi:hypothetical protein
LTTFHRQKKIPAKLKPFFNAMFRNNEDFFKVIDEKVHNYNTSRYFDKNVLIDILKRQNVTFGGDEFTAANIEQLDRRKYICGCYGSAGWFIYGTLLYNT